MDIREMRVAVLHGDVHVRVAVSAAPVPVSFMCVLVVLIMVVRMRMFLHLMKVFVRMIFSKVQPYAQTH